MLLIPILSLLKYNIVVGIILGVLIVVAVIFIYGLIVKFKKTILRYHRVLSLQKERLNETRNAIIKERQSVELQREELLAQAEHLLELNIELERLSLVASKTDTVVVIADEKGRFLWVNNGFVNLYGYSMGELINEVGNDIFEASHEIDLRTKVEKAIELKQSLNYTSFVKTKSGEQKWVKTTLNPIFDDDNNIIQYIILETDVTELKLINDE